MRHLSLKFSLGWVLFWSVLLINIQVASGEETETYTREVFATIPYGSSDENVGISPKKPDEDVSPRGPSGGIFVDPHSNIYICDCVNGKIKKFALGGKLIFATEGKLDYLRGFRIDSSGAIYAISGKGEVSTKVTKFDTQGKQIVSADRFQGPTLWQEFERADVFDYGRHKNITDPPPFPVSPAEHGVEEMSTWVLDGYGNYYGIGSAKRTTPIVLNEVLLQNSDIYILKYGVDGKLRAKINYPFSSIQSVSDRATVDSEGNIYFMQFGRNALEVIWRRPPL